MMTLSACLATGLLATTYYVAPTGGSDDNDGLSREAPFATLARGVTAIAPDTRDPAKNVGNELILMAGTHSVLDPLTVSCASNVVIRGETSNAAETTLDGDGAAVYLQFSGGPLVMRDLTVLRFAGGKSTSVLDANSPAKPVSATFDNLIVRSCGSVDIPGTCSMALKSGCRVLNTLFDNSIRSQLNGAACVAAADGSVISNCVFRNYVRVQSGAYLVEASAGSLVSDCLFADNFLGNGGAISGAFGTISNCVFRGNRLGAVAVTGSTIGYGSVIRCSNGDPNHYPLLTHCVIADNVMTNLHGCAISFYQGTDAPRPVNLTVRDCLISNNYCYVAAGGSYSARAASGAAVYGPAGTGNRFVRTRFICNSCEGDGGAVCLPKTADPVLFESCVFDGNASSNRNGGAIFGYSPVCTGCTFTRNSSICGGAVFLYTNGVSVAAFTNCIFQANLAHDAANDTNYGLGGAVNIATQKNNGAGSIYGFADFVGCLFESNEANYGGAIICGWNGAIRGLFADRCTFKGNRAKQNGGGVFLRLESKDDRRPSEVRNSVFVGNEAEVKGGGICWLTYITNEVWNCTFVSNAVKGVVTDDTNGSALSYAWTGLRILNSVFYDNFPNISETSHYSNCCFYASNGAQLPKKAGTTPGCVLNDPCLADVANGDLSLLPTSPCKDAGFTAWGWMVQASDYRGRRTYPRVYNGVVDIGAYEYRPAPGLLLLFR